MCCSPAKTSHTQTYFCQVEFLFFHKYCFLGVMSSSSYRRNAMYLLRKKQVVSPIFLIPIYAFSLYFSCAVVNFYIMKVSVKNQ
jgi:hypothetical protein